MPEVTQSMPPRSGGERARLVALPGGRAGWHPRSQLPSAVSSFVGRNEEISEVIRLVRAHRLVSLVGPGGSGKTRLALAVAGELAEIFADDLWVVELATVPGPDQVVRSLAAAMDIGERPDQLLVETLIELLQSREALVVLDNCEHLIDACADLAAALLHGCPDLRILATSREPLGITGEVAWPVPPLQQAVRLFAERAQAVRPSFTLTERTTPAVDRIVEQLDGQPLALELAAARVRVMTVDEIADRLGDALSLLVGDRGTVARHRTLEATFDWSHALLSPDERLLFRRLSIFRGGFSLAAAEAVCGDDGLDRRRVLDVLASLVDKSLVIADDTAVSTRYRLLEVVRQYAEGRLPAADADGDLADRHAAHYLALAEEAERGSTGLDEPIWFDRLALDHDNLRAALRHLVDRPQPGPEGARLAAALWAFWFVRGFPAEGIDWLQATVARAGEGEAAAAARAKALNGLVILAIFQEDYDLARASGEECLALYRELDDADGIAASLTALSTTAVAGQRHDIPVQTLIAEARSLEPRIHDRRVTAYLLDIEGALAFAGSDPAGALERWQETLDLQRQIDNLLGVCFTLTNLGLLSARLRRSEASQRWLGEALRLSSDLDYKLIIQYCLIGLGALAAQAGRPVRAARLWGAAEAMTQAFGAHLTRAGRAVLGYESEVAAARDRLDEPTWTAAWEEGARMSADQAITYALDDGSPPPPPIDRHPAGLTDREVDVLRLVAQGLTSAETGRRLFLSPRTVDWHLSSVYVKLGVRSRTEAARFAIDRGLT